MSERESSVIEGYLTHGHTKNLAIKNGIDEKTILRQAQRTGIEIRPAGRPPIIPSKRAVAMSMLVHGEPVPRIASPTVLDIGQASIFRIKSRALKDEQGLRAVGAIIENPDDHRILVHREKYPNQTYEKYQGSNSIQLSWKGNDETDYQALLRMIKAEIYGLAGNTIENWQLPEIVQPMDTANEEILEFANIMVADVLVKVYRFRMTKSGLEIPFSSTKVSNIHWAEEREIAEQINRFRSGAREALTKYLKHNDREENFVLSELNIQLKRMYLQAQS